MTQTREQFDKAVGFIKRDGLDNLIHWLESETDFFTAPASSTFHGNFEEGLLQHSLNVLSFALNSFNFMIKRKPEYEYLRESVVVASLFHDVAKVNYYFKEQKWTKDAENKWKQYLGWVVKDTFPLGHGEKSVYLVSRHILLTDSEALAIRWHHGAYEVGTTIPGQTQRSYEVAYSNPLVKLISTADLLAVGIEDTIDYKNV